MAEIDGWKDVLADAQRRVWPKVAEAVAGTGGVLMGGTAVAIHLRHRTSVDLDVMSLRAFSGRMVADRLERLSGDVQVEEAAESCLRAIVDGVLVDVFRALGREEASPDEMSMIQHGPVIDGMAVGSLPDLLATKLDVVMHRPKLRDYIDLAAIDAQTPYSLEDGLAFHQRRFGNKAGLWILDHIVGLLEDPGTLPRDPVFEHMRQPVLRHLSARVPDLREHLTDIRTGMAVDLPATPPSDRVEGGMLLDAESLLNPD